MFHQVFICDSTEDPDCLTNLVPEQNSLDDAAQVFKEEQNSSENSVVGCDQTEDLKIPVEELKSEKCRVVSNQIVLTTDTPVATKLDLESDSFVNVTESCSNLATKTEETFVLPSTSADTVDPLQIPLGRSLGQIIVQQPLSADTKPTFVHPPSVDNSDLQIKPSIETLLGANDTAVKFLSGTLVDPVTQMMGLSPGAPTQEPLLKTLKLEPTTTLDSEADIKTSQEQLTSELSDADVDDSLIMIKREGIVSEDQHLDLAKSEVRNEAVVFQEYNDNEDSKLQLKIVSSGTKRKEAESLNSPKHSNECEQHFFQSNSNVEKCFESTSSIINEHEFRSKYNIKESCVLLNNYIISDARQDSNLKNKVEPVLNDFSYNSSSDRGELGDSPDDISDSDWEEEYLHEQKKCKKKIKIKGCRKFELSTKDLSLTNIEIENNNEESNTITECHSKEESGLPITMTQNNVSGSTPSHNPLNNKNSFLTGNSLLLNNINKAQSQKEFRFKIKNKLILFTVSEGGTTNSPKNPIRSTKNPYPKNIQDSDIFLPQDPNFTHKCNKCGKSFKDIDQYHYHLRYSVCQKYKRKARFQCRICDKRFTKRHSKEAHENSHTNARPFKCSDCDKCFNSKYYRQHHYNVHHMNMDIIRHKPKQFLCCFCGYIGRNQKHVEAHEDSHRLPGGAEIPKPFKCLVCDKGFISEFKLNHHGKEHRLKKCMNCSEKFKTRGQLRNHMESAHNIVKTHVCEICGKQFKNISILRLHRNEVHSTASIYACEVCDKTFKRKGNLIQHMITHSDERPISCSECGDKFKRITHLKQHVAAVHGDGRKT